MGFDAGCVVLAGPVDVRAVVDVAAAALALLRCPPGRLVVAPAVPLDAVLEGDAPAVGLVAFLPGSAHPGNDVLAHALARGLGLPALALGSSDLLGAAVYELCVDLARDTREPGGLCVVGSALVGAARIPFLDVPRLGLGALLGRDVEARRPLAVMETLFDAALAAPGAVTVRIGEDGTPATPRRIPAGRPPEVHAVTWGFALWPATPTAARRRIAVLSRPLR